ncbi:MAG: hypothetical protein IPQ25_06640 [Chitinophagaceae bacterium]|nr:hypothetical protein [Chitinophagaceae bacterium]
MQRSGTARGGHEARNTTWLIFVWSGIAKLCKGYHTKQLRGCASAARQQQGRIGAGGFAMAFVVQDKPP